MIFETIWCFYSLKSSNSQFEHRILVRIKWVNVEKVCTEHSSVMLCKSSSESSLLSPSPLLLVPFLFWNSLPSTFFKGHFIYFFHFLNYYSFIHMCIHCLGHFSSLSPLPPSSPFPPQFQAGSVLPLSLVLLKKRDKPNKEDKVFLLVELRIAIQKYS
jgi:hypothetical protein